MTPLSHCYVKNPALYLMENPVTNSTMTTMSLTVETSSMSHHLKSAVLKFLTAHQPHHHHRVLTVYIGQYIQNSAAHLLNTSCSCEHVTPRSSNPQPPGSSFPWSLSGVVSRPRWWLQTFGPNWTSHIVAIRAHFCAFTDLCSADRSSSTSLPALR